MINTCVALAPQIYNIIQGAFALKYTSKNKHSDHTGPALLSHKSLFIPNTPVPLN